MGEAHRRIRLGFAPGEFPAGTHLCQIFSDEDERNDALLAFLLSGLQDGERAACFSEKVSPARLDRAVGDLGLDAKALRADGTLTLSGVREVYFAEGRFDPDRMLGILADFHEASARAGRGARVIGEMAPEVLHLPGGDRLMEYECRVSLFVQDHPLTAVCQYGAAAFDGATIMDVLRVHPMMVVRGSVLHNPFFIPPAQFLAQ